MPPARGGLSESRIVSRAVRVLNQGYRDVRAPRAGRREIAMVEIRRMGPQIGVEVRGVDVRTLDDQGFAPIYQAWLDCNILCVRDQDLTIPEFIAYSRRFWPGGAAPVEVDAPSRIPRDHDARGRQVRRRRQDQGRNLSPRRRGLAHRRRLQPGAVQGDPALCAGRAELRRQYAVRQRLCRL